MATTNEDRTTTRTVISYGAENLYLDGLTKGPRGGWRWDGRVLSHPTGIELVMAPEAAARISAAVAAYIPATAIKLTVGQYNALPGAERAGYERVEIVREDDNDRWPDVHYRRTTKAVPGLCHFDISEVIAVSK